MIKINLVPTPRILAQFAYFAVIGLPFLAFAILRMAGVFSWLSPTFLGVVALAVLQLVLFVAGVEVLSRLLFVVLTLVALPIGFVISHVMIAMIYYLVMTPIGLFFRLIGRDVIGRKLEPSKASYWHNRGEPRPSTSYFKLY